MTEPSKSPFKSITELSLYGYGDISISVKKSRVGWQPQETNEQTHQNVDIPLNKA